MTTRPRPRLTAATLVLALAAAPAAAELIDRVLATVSGRVVTLSDTHAALATGLVEPAADDDPIGAALSVLVDRQLVLVEVDRYAVPPPDEAAVERHVEALRAAAVARAGGRPLDELGLSDARLGAQARDDLRIAAYYDQRFGTVQPSDAEVETYYRTHPGEFTRGGVQLPFVEVRADAMRRLADERRRDVIDAWIAGLRRRADVTVLYLPGR